MATNLENPAESYDMLAGVFKGYIMGAMLVAFQGGSEQHIKIHKKPEFRHVPARASGVGIYSLVAASSSVGFVVDKRGTSQVPTGSR